MSSNPLLSIPFHIPFQEIKAGDVEPAIEILLNDARERREAIAGSAEPRTYANTLGALEDMTERLGRAVGLVRHLESVRTTPELRAAQHAIEAPVSEFYSSIPLHPGLWKQVQMFGESAEARGLTGARRRFLQKTVDDFRRHGAELDNAGKARLAEIDVALTKATTKFGENVLDSTNAFELIIEEEEKLAGLPATAVAAARQSAEQKGLKGWRFTLHGPSFLALITYLDNESLREHVYRAFSTRATRDGWDNRALLSQILELRSEKAKLLGFTDFADFALNDRMAHTGKNALDFLFSLDTKTRAAFERENRELREFAGRDLAPWDIAYYAEKQRQALYDFDEEALRPYFSATRVVDGMFEIVQRLFGISVAENAAVSGWHPDVKFFEIRDPDGLLLGAFYSDWFPRDDKRGGAWMDALLTGVDEPGRFESHLGLICGNLTPPVGTGPALLTHREVETIFHEFGHLLHHCLSRVEVRSLAGTQVAWDFVELPSQIMENWCWEREALDLFARHYETGAPIPEDLFQKMLRARNFRGANLQMRQLGFGILDLCLHTQYDPARDGDVLDYSRNLQQRFAVTELPSDYAMVSSFTHLFSSPVGYGAGYYSYKWAEVLDADAFTRFLAEGIFSREAGMSFRENILAKGNSEDPAKLYRAFMGRDPKPDALLERFGLA